MGNIVTSGKRKTSIAKAVIHEGTGKVTINRRSYKILHFFDKLKIEEPLRIAESVLGKLNFDIFIKVRGGGERGQVEAARIALSKAIIEFVREENSEKKSKAKKQKDTLSGKVERAFLDYDRNLLVADVRRKEARKPGDSKARRKRQKSYR